MNTNSCIGNIRKNILHNKEMIMYSNWFLNFLIPYKGTFFKYDAENSKFKLNNLIIFTLNIDILIMRIIINVSLRAENN